MIDLDAVISRLSANAEAVRALMQSISGGQAQWKPRPETWSVKEVMEHVYNEERMDFRQHLKMMLEATPAPVQYAAVENHRLALDGFLTEREASVTWLKSLTGSDWSITMELHFGESETLVISAAEMLLSWVEHDFLHLRQMIELHHAWNEKQASPGSLKYAGGW